MCVIVYNEGILALDEQTCGVWPVSYKNAV